MAQRQVSDKWKNLAGRMQHIACDQRGYAIVRVSVLVGPNGEPVLWTQPSLDKIEPVRDSSDVLRQIILNLRNEMPQLAPDK